jgi:hypothetical protein
VTQLVSKLQDELRVIGMASRKELIISILSLDRRMRINEKGVSLTSWRHVNPKLLFDKIVFVLREIQKPMHFQKIAEYVSAKKFDSKSLSIQAVHNELINNPVFVLVGRGIYALQEWGYKDGTVEEVLKDILASRGPLPLNDLTREVLQRRQVKPITIQINLNSKKESFCRNDQGFYELKK